MRRYLLSLLLVFCSVFAWGQTSLSGVINTYHAVTAIRPPVCGNCDSSCTDTLVLSSVAGLSPVPGAQGNKVLLIQMQAGASGTINSGAAFQFSPLYGQVTNFGGAGNWELAFIQSIIGNEITFTNPLLNNYEVAGNVQVVPVPVYGTVTTTGNLLGMPWNGNTGGVFILECTGSLTLNDSILMDGAGFRGGIYQDRGTACCNSNNIDAALRFGYFWDETQAGGGPPCGANRQVRFGEEKGEGIFPLITGERIGRGAFANGGGGGSGHNSGAGGGGNGMAGGFGGYEWDGCAQAVADMMNGVGGYGITSGNALFMGGGGGSGHGNNGVGTSGANGGGIIILISPQVNSTLTGLEISADGLKPNLLAGNDAAGGGGAGGTIFLDVGSFTGQALAITANGGAGGDNTVNGSCHGPGGGGGAGVIRTTSPLPIPGITTSVVGGPPGTHTVDLVCGSYGAGAGGSSSATGGNPVQINPCVVLPQSGLQLVGRQMQGKNFLELSWPASYRIEQATIFRSRDAENWEELATETVRQNSAWEWTDPHGERGTNWYRMRVTDVNGAQELLGPVALTLKGPESGLKVYPNPVRSGQPLYLQDPDGATRGTELILWGCDGRKAGTFRVESDGSVRLHGISPGVYIISSLKGGQRRQTLISILP